MSSKLIVTKFFLDLFILTVGIALFFVAQVQAEEVTIGSKLKFGGYCSNLDDTRRLAVLATMENDRGYTKAIRDPEIKCWNIGTHKINPVSVTLKELVFTIIREDGETYYFWRADDKTGLSGFVWMSHTEKTRLEAKVQDPEQPSRFIEKSKASYKQKYLVPGEILTAPAYCKTRAFLVSYMSGIPDKRIQDGCYVEAAQPCRFVKYHGGIEKSGTGVAYWIASCVPTDNHEWNTIFILLSPEKNNDRPSGPHA